MYFQTHKQTRNDTHTYEYVYDTNNQAPVPAPDLVPIPDAIPALVLVPIPAPAPAPIPDSDPVLVLPPARVPTQS